MLSITINFDPLNQNDCHRVLDYILSNPCMSKQREALKNMNGPANNANLQEIQSLRSSLRERDELIKRHERENEQKEKRIQEQDAQLMKLKNSLEQEIKKLNEENDNLLKELNNAYDEAKKVNEENEKKLNSANKKLGEQEQQYTCKLGEKEREIRKLRKQLENYSVSFGSDDPSEKIYFGVSENGSLEESMISSSSLYCANRKGDKYRFAVNTEDGPIKSAISNCERFLMPFCEITLQEDGANTIHINSVGQAQIVGSQLHIITKANISLLKQ